ncbi:tetratricopeptide repeat protein [Verrucomicrobium spinosum]|uniref:tetratricopeptide repeat protein n=1 Tax=Verrucomicrobium spinosum TaxID=2736 RepID=UPI003CCD6DBB
MREKELGPQSTDTLDSQNNLALILASKREFEESAKLYRKVLIAREGLQGKEHPST